MTSHWTIAQSISRMRGVYVALTAQELSDNLCKIKKASEEAILVGRAVSALVLPYASKFLSGA